MYYNEITKISIIFVRIVNTYLGTDYMWKTGIISLERDINDT